MIKFRPEDKKEASIFLAEHPTEVMDFLNYPRYFWDINLPDSLKNLLKDFQKKYENINALKETFIINRLRSFMTDSDKVFYLEQSTYWKRFPYLDFLADLLYFKINPDDALISSDNDIYTEVNQNLLQDIQKRLSNLRLETISFQREQQIYNYQQMKPGKFLKKLFPDATAQDCELFQQAWVKYYAKWSWPALEITPEIIKHYHHKQYAEIGKGPLGASCMRHDSALRFLHFYEINKVKMVIFRDPSDTTKIRARALVWEDIYLPDSAEKTKFNLPDHITFVDRIYFQTEEERLLVETWAAKMNFYVKKSHQPGWTGMVAPDGTVIDPLIRMTYNIEHPCYPFPYIDTFPYLIEENDGSLYVSNVSSMTTDRQIILRSIDGHYEGTLSCFTRATQEKIQNTYLPFTNRTRPYEEVKICLNCYTAHVQAVCPNCGE